MLNIGQGSHTVDQFENMYKKVVLEREYQCDRRVTMDSVREEQTNIK